MTDPHALQEDAVRFATRAVTCDKNGLHDTAVFYYMVIFFFMHHSIKNIISTDHMDGNLGMGIC